MTMTPTGGSVGATIVSVSIRTAGAEVQKHHTQSADPGSGMVMQMAIGFAVVSEALSAEAMGAATAPSDKMIAVVARAFADFLCMVRTFRRAPSKGNRKARSRT
ncbi:hypothetical protein B7C42_01588 [Nocardia cerradoensis]|uniref:Uncharacterized protein n=1 Tax=Nocardia cerradoensis TaxID=85688 RepID=A0A231HD34_9NOCA|nr:hypothetical protein B7C42_01588 [Nocardia cerradoensis]